jgi:hypothetical protein
VISLTAAKEQIRRLRQYPTWDRLEGPEKDELARALQEGADSKDHAERIVTDILNDSERKFVPQRGEIRAACKFTPREKPRTGIGCSKCRPFGTPGFVSAASQFQFPGAVVMCECHPGRRTK